MRNTFFLITAGILLPLLIQAQINEDIDLNKGNQDSIAFHQSFISESLSDDNSITARSTATNNNGNFTLAGNAETFYPVAFQDHGWDNNEATILEIGRSSIHANSSYNGSLIASFRFHLSRSGHLANFVDVDLRQNNPSGKYFIGGWYDTTLLGSGSNLIIWLKGAATYYYHSNYLQSPVYTSSSMTLESKTYSPKTRVDDYVNQNGKTLSEKNLWVLGSHTNYFKSNVGIGTNTPKYLLDVNGSIRGKSLYLENSFYSESNGYARIYYPGVSLMVGTLPYSATDCALDIRPGEIESGSKQSVITMWQANSQKAFEKKIQFRTNGNSYFNGGNVGIGTDNPKNKLDVAGTIRATEVKVETGWADFVFDKDYKLPSLEEVECHINEHKRLPDIPSESQVKEEGVGLGEMQVKLLQKIEELTLYMIHQSKEIQHIKQENKKLREQINNLP